MEETEIAGLATDQETFYSANITGERIIQVTFCEELAKCTTINSNCCVAVSELFWCVLLSGYKLFTL